MTPAERRAYLRTAMRRVRRTAVRSCSTPFLLSSNQERQRKQQRTMLSSRDVIDTVHPAIPHLRPRREALSSPCSLPCVSVCTDIAPRSHRVVQLRRSGQEIECRQLRFHCDRGDLDEQHVTFGVEVLVARRTEQRYPRAVKLRKPYRCLPRDSASEACLRRSAFEHMLASYKFQCFGRSQARAPEVAAHHLAVSWHAPNMPHAALAARA